MMSLIAAAAALAATPLADEPVTAPGPLAPLAGTLTGAGEGRPVVLIIPGSGPTDRDGNNPLGVAAQPYKLLAEGLAAKGIASVRIDKRGMFGSKAAVADPNAVTVEDYAGDVHSWIGAIRAKTGAQCVWVLGHSEGVLIALAASRRPEGICGLILVSGAGRSLDVVLREQLHANPANAPILPQADAALDALKAGKDVDVATMNPALLPIFSPKVQGYLKSVFANDPAKLVAGYKGPVLIVQGERDIQVGVGDAQALKAADPTATLALLPDTNHVLKSVVSDDRAANVATYGDASLPLAPGVVETIAGFIKR